VLGVSLKCTQSNGANSCLHPCVYICSREVLLKRALVLNNKTSIRKDLRFLIKVKKREEIREILVIFN